MADNYTATLGTSGTTAAFGSDELSTAGAAVQYPRLKVFLGADGTGTDWLYGYGTTATAALVTLASDQPPVKTTGSILIDNWTTDTQVSTGNIVVRNIVAGTITTANVSADVRNVTTGQIAASIVNWTTNTNVSTGNVSAQVRSITTGTVNVENVSTGNLSVQVRSVTTGDMSVQVRSLTTGNVAVASLTTGNVAVASITTGNIAVASLTTGNVSADVRNVSTGTIHTIPYGDKANYVYGSTTNIANTTIAIVLTSQGANVGAYITALLVTNAHSTVGTWVTIMNGATTGWTGWAAEGGGGFAQTFPTPLPGLANNPWSAKCETSGAAVRVSMSGYKGAA